MRRKLLGWAFALFCGASLLLTSCRSGKEVVFAGGECIAMDSTWDASPDAEAMSLLAPYKARKDSVMNVALGASALSMDSHRPESLLSNLVADVLREAAAEVLKHPADVAVMNMGGIRGSLSEGTVTVEEVYEILPFENALCVLTMSGEVLNQLFANMAARGGEGLSGARLEIGKDGRLLSATVAGRPVDDDKMYTVATIDYLSEGNDGLTAMKLADDRIYPENMVLRDVFIRYVQRQTAAGRKLTSRLEGRIVVKD